MAPYVLELWPSLLFPRASICLRKSPSSDCVHFQLDVAMARITALL